MKAPSPIRQLQAPIPSPLKYLNPDAVPPPEECQSLALGSGRPCFFYFYFYLFYFILFASFECFYTFLCKVKKNVHRQLFKLHKTLPVYML